MICPNCNNEANSLHSTEPICPACIKAIRDHYHRRRTLVARVVVAMWAVVFAGVVCVVSKFVWGWMR
jgi:predicted amidophosphoribosyltransferase